MRLTTLKHIILVVLCFCVGAWLSLIARHAAAEAPLAAPPAALPPLRPRASPPTAAIPAAAAASPAAAAAPPAACSSWRACFDDAKKAKDRACAARCREAGRFDDADAPPPVGAGWLPDVEVRARDRARARPAACPPLAPRRC